MTLLLVCLAVACGAAAIQLFHHEVVAENYAVLWGVIIGAVSGFTGWALITIWATAVGAATVMYVLLARLRTSRPRLQLSQPAASDDSAGDRPPVMGGLLPIAEVDELKMWRANLRALIDEMNLGEVRRLQDYAWSIRGK